MGKKSLVDIIIHSIFAIQKMRKNHIKADWETHQFFMKYRDKLSFPMAGPNFARSAFCQADYKG